MTGSTDDCDQNHMHLGFWVPTIATVLAVNRRSRLVALFLLFGLLAGPAAAVSRCWTGVSGSVEHCRPRCPMMAKTPGAPVKGFQRAPHGPNCCQISPAGPAPVSESAASPDRSAASEAKVQMPLSVVSVAVVARTLDETPPPLLVHSQAVLCTFLI